MPRNALSVLLRAWLLTAVSDGLFSSALSKFAYHSTVTRLWQGVASTLLGPSAFEGGRRTVAIGLLMHLSVALTWSTVFLTLALISPQLRRFISAPSGVAAAAALYGPSIWLMMSLAVIPFLTGRPPSFTVRWWVQFFGHIPFVALPIVAVIGRGIDDRNTVARRPRDAANQSLA